MSILKIKELSKTFRTGKRVVEVLDKVSLDVEKQDIFGVIGLSGEGKSTLVRCINRLETADSGIISYNDGENVINDISLLKGKELREYRKNVSMIFQDFNLLNQKNVYQNVEFPLTLTKGYKRTLEIEKRIKLINTGVYCVNIKILFNALPKIKNDNKKGEYYLTDIVQEVSKENNVNVIIEKDSYKVLGVNDLNSLTKLEIIFKEKKK